MSKQTDFQHNLALITNLCSLTEELKKIKKMNINLANFLFGNKKPYPFENLEEIFKL